MRYLVAAIVCMISVSVFGQTDILGCTTSIACNYNPDATIDDGSCEFICYGCTDSFACNYDPSANVDDSSCEYLSCAGCTVAIACNYNLESTIDDNSCTYPESQFLDCDGNCLNDSDGDGVCDELEIVQCTDLLSCNFENNLFLLLNIFFLPIVITLSICGLSSFALGKVVMICSYLIKEFNIFLNRAFLCSPVLFSFR